MKLLMSSKKKIKVIKIKSKKEIYLKIIQLIKKSLKKNDTLMIAGGKTYLNFYKFLSKKLNINSINILLTDERLSKNILRTNNYLIKKNLPNYEKKNFFFDIKNYNFDNKNYFFKKINKHPLLKKKVSLALIGVGMDAHIASIFPDNKPILKSKKLLLIKNENDNFKRISFSLDYIKKIETIIFFFFEKKKMHLLKSLSKKIKNSYNLPFYNLLRKNKKIYIFVLKK